MNDLKDYQLTIRIPIKAIDDPDARVRAKSVLGDFRAAGLLGLEDTGGVSEKLQRLELNKPPTKVDL
jgi:hypothetical protein